jgi:hypothetical protein
LNRTEVLERIEPITSTQVRTMEANPKTRIMVTPEMVVLRPGGGQHHLEMTTEGAKSMAKFVGIPENMAGKLSPATFGQVATELLGRQHRYSVMVRDRAIVGFHKPTEFRALSPDRVLKAIEAGIKGIEYHRVLMLNNFVISLELIGERREPVIAGDLVQAGAQVTFSPIGTVDPLVQSYALRLVCTNGVTSNTVLREFHYGGGGGGEGDDIWQWFRRSSREAYNSLHRIVTRYRRMMDEAIPADQRAMVLEAMLREAKISGDDANAIRAMAIENPPQNSYDMMNLLSNATSHILEDPRRVRRAQDAVANYTSEDQHARVCPVCHARRN